MRMCAGVTRLTCFLSLLTEGALLQLAVRATTDRPVIFHRITLAFQISCESLVASMSSVSLYLCDCARVCACLRACDPLHARWCGTGETHSQCERGGRQKGGEGRCTSVRGAKARPCRIEVIERESQRQCVCVCVAQAGQTVDRAKEGGKFCAHSVCGVYETGCQEGNRRWKVPGG